MTFEEWFTAQHGKRPSNMKSWDIARQVGRTSYELARLQALYRACELWDEQAKSAMYAWNLKDTDKSAWAQEVDVGDTPMERLFGCCADDEDKTANAEFRAPQAAPERSLPTALHETPKRDRVNAAGGIRSNPDEDDDTLRTRHSPHTPSDGCRDRYR